MGFEPMCCLYASLSGYHQLRRLDSNQRLSGYEPDVLPGCTTPQ